MIVVLAELEEGYDSMQELEFDSEFGVGISSETELQLWRGDNFGEGPHVRLFYKIRFKVLRIKRERGAGKKGWCRQEYIKMKSMTSPS